MQEEDRRISNLNHRSLEERSNSAVSSSHIEIQKIPDSDDDKDTPRPPPRGIFKDHRKVSYVSGITSLYINRILTSNNYNFKFWRR